MKKLILAMMTMIATAVGAGEWRGLGDEEWISGPKLKPERLKGRVVFVECWGLNCPPCRASLPHVQRLYRKFGPKGVVFIGSHCQRGAKEDILALLKEAGVEYSIYQFAGYSEGPRISGIPAPFLVDHTGKVVWNSVGFNPKDAETAIAAALKAAPNLEHDVLLAEIEDNLTARPGIAYMRLQSFLKKFPKEKAAVAEAQGKLKDPKVKNMAKLEGELEKLRTMPANNPAMLKKRSDTAKALARKAKALGSEALEADFNEFSK